MPRLTDYFDEYRAARKDLDRARYRRIADTEVLESVVDDIGAATTRGDFDQMVRHLLRFAEVMRGAAEDDHIILDTLEQVEARMDRLITAVSEHLKSHQHDTSEDWKNGN